MVEEENEKKFNVLSSDKVMKIKDVIGRALNRIGTYNDLNNQEQVVALIDEVNLVCFFFKCNYFNH